MPRASSVLPASLAWEFRKSGARTALTAYAQRYFGLPAWLEKQTEPPTEEDILLASEREGYDMTESLRARRAAPKPDGKPPKDPIGFGKARADLDWVLESKRYKG